MRISLMLNILALLMVAATAHVLTVGEEQCQNGLYKAGAKYAACEHKAESQLYKDGATNQHFLDLTHKCGTKYAVTWAKLQAKAAGSGATCDNPRFADNGDGTVTDRLTALQWEKKANLDGMINFADPHDADNGYAWTAGTTPSDGHCVHAVPLGARQRVLRWAVRLALADEGGAANDPDVSASVRDAALHRRGVLPSAIGGRRVRHRDGTVRHDRPVVCAMAPRREHHRFRRRAVPCSPTSVS